MNEEKQPGEVSGLLSEEDIYGLFSSYKPFASELEIQTLGRLTWLVTRQAAIFLIIAHEQTRDPLIASILSSALATLALEIDSFVSEGIDAEAAVEPIQHPMQQAIQNAINAVREPEGSTNVTQIIEVAKRSSELFHGSDEDILHLLNKLRPAD